MYKFYQALDYLLIFAQYSIFARVIISWLPIPKNNGFIRFLYQITEPVLGPIRKLLEKSVFGRNSMLDFSPILAFLLIGFLRNLVRSLMIRSIF